MIDLHIHTTYSDGEDDEIEILKKAQKAGLEVMSVTDHESVDFYLALESINVEEFYKGKIIVGCEMETIYKGIPIEVLGYNINPLIIKPWFDKYFSDEAIVERYNRYLKKIMEKSDKIGVKYDPNIVVTDRNASYCYLYMKDVLSRPENEKYFDKKVWENYEFFYRMCVSNKESPFYIDSTEDRIPLPEVLDQIHKAGGKAFIAHSYIYSYKNIIETIDEIVKSYDIDGIECYYSSFTEEQIKEVLEYCKKNNLAISGGSDFHGEDKRKQRLGVGLGNLNIPVDILDTWK